MVLTLGPPAQVRAPQVANYALVNVQMHYMHMHTFALKMPPVGLEPTTLTHVAQTITQLTKWSGGPRWFALGFTLVVYRYRARSGFTDLKPPLSRAIMFYSLKTERLMGVSETPQ